MAQNKYFHNSEQFVDRIHELKSECNKLFAEMNSTVSAYVREATEEKVEALRGKCIWFSSSNSPRSFAIRFNEDTKIEVSTARAESYGFIQIYEVDVNVFKWFDTKPGVYDTRKISYYDPHFSSISLYYYPNADAFKYSDPFGYYSGIEFDIIKEIDESEFDFDTSRIKKCIENFNISIDQNSYKQRIEELKSQISVYEKDS